MNQVSGQVYPSLAEALRTDPHPEDVVEVIGRQDQIDRLSADIRKVRSEERRQVEKKRRRAAETSRKKNRRKR